MSAYADRLRDIAARADVRDATILQLVADGIDLDRPVPYIPTDVVEDEHETAGQGDLGPLGEALVGAERAIRAALDAGADPDSVTVEVTVHHHGAGARQIAAAAAPLGTAHQADGLPWVRQETKGLHVLVFDHSGSGELL